MPYRSHAARFHTSETVSGWNYAPPATVIESCLKNSGGTTDATLKGFRLSMNQEPLAVKRSKPSQPLINGVKPYTNPYAVKYGPPQDVGICLDLPREAAVNIGNNKQQEQEQEEDSGNGPYDAIIAVKGAIGLKSHAKPKAVEERSETEEGWIREVEDELVLDSRFDLDMRLAWVSLLVAFFSSFFFFF
jgi:hypothetical protein